MASQGFVQKRAQTSELQLTDTLLTEQLTKRSRNRP